MMHPHKPVPMFIFNAYFATVFEYKGAVWDSTNR